MSETGGIYPKIVAYLVVFFNLVGGLQQIVEVLSQDVSHSSNGSSTSETVVGGVLSIVLGIVLLIGAINENYKYVLAYLCISIPLTTLGTFVVIIDLVAAKPQAKYVFLTFVILVLTWAVQYGLYVFYRQLLYQTRSMEVSASFNNGVPLTVVTIPSTRVEKVDMVYNEKLNNVSYSPLPTQGKNTLHNI